MIPPRFARAEVSDLDPVVMEHVIQYVASFKERVEAGVGLLLSGAVGVGKTHALAALTRYYERRAVRPNFEFLSAYEVQERYCPVVPSPDTHDRYRGQSWTSTLDTCEWLVVNDLGKDYRGGKLAEQATYRVGRLLRTRSERRLVTHLTTNLPIEDGDGPTFRSIYGESIYSLVRESMDRIVVEGPDRRRLRL